jgi:hypothetical protein
LLVSSGGVHASDTPPTTIVGNAAPSAREAASSPPHVEAIRRALPVIASVEAVARVRESRRSYDEATLRADDGSRFVVVVYQHFDEAELDGADLRRIATPDGVMWVGADDPELVSVYFKSAAGTSVWLSHSAANSAVVPVSLLGRIAARVASAPSVVAQASAR